MKNTCEVHFLDVGQGSCTVVFLGGYRAIVIDSARSSPIPLKVLTKFVDFIEVLVITHNDIDHIGGATKIITEYGRKKSIGDIWYLCDRMPGRTPEICKFTKIIRLLVQQGCLTRDKVHRLERRQEKETIFSRQGTELQILAPDFLGNQDALDAEEPHMTSGVLRLECNGNAVIFSGDATASTWRLVIQRYGKQSCCAITMPHHGGRIEEKDADEAAWKWLFQEAVETDVAIISVGTANQYSQPQPHAIEQAVNSNTHVLCTEITKHCCSLPQNLGNGVIPATPYSHSGLSLPRAKNSMNVACAGTITLLLANGKAEWGNKGEANPICGFSGLEQHKIAVAKAAKRKLIVPLCS